MLSRLAFNTAARSVKWSSFRKIQTSSAVSAAAGNEQRDLVNFPRTVRQEECSPVRVGLFPEHWHAAIAEKTGSTGLYVGIGTITAFLFSKEIWVIEHEFWIGLTYFGLFLASYNKFREPFMGWINSEVDKEDNKYKSIRQGEIDLYEDMIKDEEKAQFMATSYENLIDAKKESVALQLENAYRARLQTVYEQVKKRLDYQLETANANRRLEQRHMVNWIIDGVTKSISAKQEDEALKKCITDLKTLA